MSSRVLASLLLPADAFDLNTHQVMGRRIAGSSFARGICASLRQEESLTIFTGNREAIPSLQALLQPELHSGVALRVHAELEPSLIAQSGCLHLPDPGLHHWCWLRAGQPSQSFSLTGVTHTLCSHGVMQGLEQLLTAPLEPWDALICTSRSAQRIVQEAMGCMHQRLERRFQQTLPTPTTPQLPLIPLGIDPKPFAWQGRFANRTEQRRQARQRLGLSQTARVVLFLGRLSFHSKAHPLPLYRALSRLAKKHNIVLLECGHIFNPSIAAAYDELGQRFPQLNIHRLGGLNPASEEDKQLALAAADIFCSPADNLQETFGLSVLEAMASSLPVVASDWNGYRDLVVHGTTGWLVPCRDLLKNQAQPDSMDRRFSLGLQDYDSTVGLRSLGVVIDHAALEQALNQLLASAEQCAVMGDAGQQRIASVFAWTHVSHQYRDLWAELQQRRTAATTDALYAPWPVANAARLFTSHANQPPAEGPWYLNGDCTDPAVLSDTMQTCFFQQLVATANITALANALKLEHDKGNQVFQEAQLHSLLQHCGIPADLLSRTISLLEKLGIVMTKPA